MPTDNKIFMGITILTASTVLGITLAEMADAYTIDFPLVNPDLTHEVLTGVLVDSINEILDRYDPLTVTQEDLDLLEAKSTELDRLNNVSPDTYSAEIDTLVNKVQAIINNGLPPVVMTADRFSWNINDYNCKFVGEHEMVVCTKEADDLTS